MVLVEAATGHFPYPPQGEGHVGGGLGFWELLEYIGGPDRRTRMGPVGVHGWVRLEGTGGSGCHGGGGGKATSYWW